jgi:hypothetical protein
VFEMFVLSARSQGLSGARAVGVRATFAFIIEFIRIHLFYLELSESFMREKRYLAARRVKLKMSFVVQMHV